MTLYRSELQQGLFANTSVLMEKAQSREKVLQGRGTKNEKGKGARAQRSVSH